VRKVEKKERISISGDEITEVLVPVRKKRTFDGDLKKEAKFKRVKKTSIQGVISQKEGDKMATKLNKTILENTLSKLRMHNSNDLF